jgi:segregation and condensation protein B
MPKPDLPIVRTAGVLDVELADLPPEARWREWMGRVEAAVFASAEPVPRDVLARLVGRHCVLDDLIADIRDELKGRPYELVSVAGGWQHRTRPKFAQAIRAAANIPERAKVPDLSQFEILALATIAYRQPVTRAALSEVLGRDVSRDILARLKRIGLIAGGPRAPFPGAPLTYVTTPRFLSTFGLATLHDLPEMGGSGEDPAEEEPDRDEPIIPSNSDSGTDDVREAAELEEPLRDE